MIIETLRLFTIGLGDSGYGINAQIAALDVFAGDSVPPNIVTISDEASNIEVSNSRPLKPFPSVAVVQAGPSELDANVLTTTREGEVVISLLYYAENSQTHNVKRDAFYTLRALEAFLNDFFQDTNDADRVDNSIQVCFVTELRHEIVLSSVEDNYILGQLTVTLKVRDIAP